MRAVTLSQRVFGLQTDDDMKLQGLAQALQKVTRGLIPNIKKRSVPLSELKAKIKKELGNKRLGGGMYDDEDPEDDEGLSGGRADPIDRLELMGGKWNEAESDEEC
jgi:hypothetical protein